MATKSGNKGRYICKVGYLDIYAKDTMKPKKESKYKFTKGDVKSTVYNILHGKKLSLGNLNTKDDAVAKAIELMGDKAALYGLV
jgi:hypothetical protein